MIMFANERYGPQFHYTTAKGWINARNAHARSGLARGLFVLVAHLVVGKLL
jgi:hypothetical protein